MFIAIIIILTLLLTSIGQILLKLGANLGVSLLLNRFVILGYLSFFFVMVLSTFLMTKIDLKYFGVLMSINYIVTILLANLVLGERVSLRRIAGCVLISIGATIFYFDGL